MKFFSPQTIANQPSYNQPNQPNQKNNMFFMQIRNTYPPVVQNRFVEPLVVREVTPSPTKVKWGEPTWYLLHVLSIKVKDSEFNNIRVDLLNRIYAICTNLPCPDCANHAKTYLDNINFNSIQTKEDLKLSLYNFHNEVNKRKGYAFFPYDTFEEKYTKAITTNIIRNFMFYFSDKHRSFKLLPNDLHRAQLCIILKKWFNENIQCFDM
jgi:hypothetical protein